MMTDFGSGSLSLSTAAFMVGNKERDVGLTVGGLGNGMTKGRNEIRLGKQSLN